jgi:hypothetical protein
MVDVVNFEMHDKQVNNCWFTGDNDNIVDRISNAHQFFVTDYFDYKREIQYLNDYKFSLAEICNFQKIKLVSLDWSNIAVSNWIDQGRHPNAVEHREIAELIYKKYYEN